MDSQLRAGVTLRGIQWVDSTVAVVVSSDPHLLSQLQSDGSTAAGDVVSVPQVHFTAEIKHQGLDIHMDTTVTPHLFKCTNQTKGGVSV